MADEQTPTTIPMRVMINCEKGCGTRLEVYDVPLGLDGTPSMADPEIERAASEQHRGRCRGPRTLAE